MPLRIRASALVAVVLTTASSACVRPETGVCTGDTVQLRREDALTVGADFAYPPFAFDDPETGRPTGFEVQLVEALARELGLKLLLENRSSPALIPGLLARRHDIAASGLRDSPSLREEACVSNSYLSADLGVLVSGRTDDDGVSVEDVANLKVGVVRGSRAQRWARTNVRGPLTVFQTSDDVVASVRNGTVAAAIDDLPIMRFAAMRSRDVRVSDVIETPEEYVLAGNPENAGLMKLVNDALAAVHENGTLDRLRERWFGA